MALHHHGCSGYCCVLLLLSLALCLIGSAFASPRFEEDDSGSGSAARQDNWQGGTHAGSDSNGLAKPPTSLANGSTGRQAGSKHVPEALRRFNFNARKADFARTSNGEESDGESTPKLTGHLDWAHGSEETTRQQVELADFALVITVDGSIHAIKRDTGTWLWSLHDDNTQDQRQDVVQSPLFRASMRNASLLRQNRADSTTRSENSSNIASGINDREQLDNLTEEADEDDEVYIIEPHSAGDIYVFHKKTSKLQRLPLSLTQLVELSPFTFPVRGPSSDKDSINTDDKLFVGRKESKLVGVDLRSGKLVGVFGPEAGWCEWPQPGSGDGSAGPSQSQRSNKYLPDVDDAIENRPRDLLYLGQTDYHLSIYSKTQGLLQTLSYTSYGPSSLGHGEGSPFGPFPGEESEYRPSLDGRYIQPMHDGSLVCLDPKKDGIQWTNRFSQPVVGVFDVWYPPAQEGSTAAASQPVLSMHPHHRIHNQLKELASAPPSTFVGRLTRAGHDQGEQEYYAMSNYHFPLVSFAPASSAISGGSTSSGGHNRSQQSILGSHRVDEPIDSGRTIDAASAPLAIDPPESPARLPAGRDSVHNRPSLPPASYEAGYGEAMLKYLGIGGLDPTVSLLETTFLLAGLLVFSFAYMRKKMMNGRPSKRQENTLSIANGAQVEAQEERVSSSEGSISQQGTASFGSSSGPLVQKMRGIGHASSPSFDKELPALPVVEVPNPSNEADVVGSDEEVCADGDENGPDKARNPKKGRRRRRGGKRNTNKSTNGEGLEERDRPSPELVREEEPPSDKDINMPIVKTIPPVVAQDKSSSDVVGNLVVSESVIGYGSHGTVVLKGTFQGRAVAVKRLLKDFVSVASHEVSLLQESDDHPNVIRYFCKESRANFHYIALELCPTSLFELIDTPQAYPTIIANFDATKALKQMAKGLAHLHKLKIIHRDLKPQNILVATSAGKRPDDGPIVRLVISDFGLCKKLDLDESSFLQSTRGGGNHAPGSFGYRAPEVLRGEVNANDLVNEEPSSTSVEAGQESSLGSRSASTSSTATLAAEDSNKHAGSGRKLTRAIDIFSLGCIFYFVLTMGEHPFGSRYEREINILNDKIILDGLSVMTENQHEAKELIRHMCAANPRTRPTANDILLDPLFWTASHSLHFLCDASDRFEIMEKDHFVLGALEADAPEIVGNDWLKSLDRNLIDNLGKYRKYDGGSVRDLLRVMRNKKHHYQDLPENLRRSLGEPPDGFLSYFTRRFPRLVLHVHGVVKQFLAKERMFAPYFEHDDP